MAAAGGGGRGGVGWAILAAALAVPGFLFYNWWSHLKAERDHAISAKAIKRADGGVFQTPPPQAGRLINPMAPSTGAPAGFVSAAAPPRPSTGAASGFARTPAAGPPGASAAPSMMAPARMGLPGPLPAAPSSSTTAASAAPAVSLSTAATVVLSRDPMMSPMDKVRLQEAALAEEARLRALAEANNPRRRAKKRVYVQPPVETRIELQGIVAKADGDNLAIINGSTVNPGDTFAVDNYKGKVKVLKISSSVVTLEYNGRKFRLSVNVE